ncbi:MAG TPA: glycosyltransferase [Candidatus Eisenbacteria bacterium]|jgi:glycosyltransferase involved in cell wall biosynthesis|nr:glycosyltransferase [Candidatus Eisenbacteria bacterium]
MRTPISVIVPSYNARKTLGRTLDSLSQQTSPGLLREIIVVDSSDDGLTRDLLASRAGSAGSAPLRVVDGGRRLSPALGRNMGAELARGETLLFLDADAYLAPDALERVAAQRALGRRVGGGSVSLPPFQKNSPLPLAQFFLQFNEFADRGKARPKAFAPSCNLFCERELFAEAGGFPDIRASEDVLFGLNVNRLATFWFVPEIRAFHVFREDAKAFLSNQALLGRYVLVWRRLRRNSFYVRGAWALAFLPLILVVKFLRITARVLRCGPSLFLAYLKSLPAFVPGLFAWAAGFASAAADPSEGRPR